MRWGRHRLAVPRYNLRVLTTATLGGARRGRIQLPRGPSHEDQQNFERTASRAPPPRPRRLHLDQAAPCSMALKFPGHVPGLHTRWRLPTSLSALAAQARAPPSASWTVNLFFWGGRGGDPPPRARPPSPPETSRRATSLGTGLPGVAICQVAPLIPQSSLQRC